MINIVRNPDQPRTWRRVQCDNELQYEALDMLGGRSWTRLGGAPKYLDVVGVNFYSDNQFTMQGETVRRGEVGYTPLSELLVAVSRRYQRPMLITETGGEGDARAPWLAYVTDECLRAMEQGCELHGLTLYPVLDHPGWLDDRHCPNGLWGYADAVRERAPFRALLDLMTTAAPRLLAARTAMLKRVGR